MIYKSIDGGINWFQQNANSTEKFYSVNFIDSLVGIQPISTITPESYELYQNYPNPFNPVTNIKYQLVHSGFVKLSVYDMLGREIGRIINQDQKAGTYTVQYDASKLSSGAYFYRIESQDFTETKKMILVK